jgi:hypothetical protein
LIRYGRDHGGCVIRGTPARNNAAMQLSTVLVAQRVAI